MEEKRTSIHGLWSSSWVFILAATGAAVGLGNIWKFPYIAGQNGGGAFVVIYLLCTLILGVPLLICEILLGRSGRQNPANTIQSIAIESDRTKHWRLIGGLIILAGPLILSYYSIISGWALAYVFKALSGIFYHIDANQAKLLFENFINNPAKLIFWHSLIMLGSTIIVAKGLEKGIEKTITFMLPIMVILLCVLVIYGTQSDYIHDTLLFLFKPNFSKLTAHSILIALGQTFFSLSIATGAIIMYGAYLPRSTSIARSAIIITLADTGIALLAGLAIFPIVFANNLEPSTGPGLIFQTLPIAFGKMPYGSIFATLFFVMLVFAAFTSIISLIEPAVAWLIEVKNLTRARAASTMGLIIWLLGFTVIFSFNIWKNFKILGATVFESIDYLTANIMLPISALSIAIFTAWRLPRTSLKQELQMRYNCTFQLWHCITRYIAPIAILIVFISGII